MVATASELAIIGGGMAALRLAETLRRRGDRRSIAIFGAERALPYNRILLSPLLAGECDWQQLITHPESWYREQRIELHPGRPVQTVDTARRRVYCSDGFIHDYAELVFATGARAALPPLPGIGLKGVGAFRNVDDVGWLQRAASRGGNAVVLGGGLLGLEAAVALATRGMTVTLVHRAEQLMNRQLDAVAAAYLQRAVAARGVAVRTGCAPQAILGEACVEGVLLADGERLRADLVVVATGIEPVTELAAAAGLAVARGIVVDAQLRSSAAHVYALGECCELNGETVGMVAPIWRQVDVLAANLCGDTQEFQPGPHVTMLKVSGIDVHAMGLLEADAGCHTLTYQDRALGIYKKIIVRNRIAVGAMLFGDVADSQCFFSLIQNRTELDGAGCRLLLAGEMPAAAIAATA